MREIISELRLDLIKNQGRLSQYYDYYKGKHKITQSESWETRSNAIEVHNFCKMFIDNNTGFLLGNNIQLKYNNGSTTNDDNIVKYHNKLLGAEIQQKNQKLMRDIQIFGYAYEVNYIDKDGAFATTIKTPLELSVVRVGNKVEYGLLYQGKSGENTIYDFFDTKKNMVVRVHMKDENIVKTEKPNVVPFDNPIIVVYNNWEKQSEMEDIMTLNDAYNQVSSDAQSEIHDFRNAYLHFKGVTLDEDILKNMNRSGIISTKADSEVKFITKDVNNKFIEDKLDQLKTQIYDVSGQVNFNDTGVGSNTSSLALRNKLTNLINKLRLKEGFLKEAVLIRFKNLEQYINTIKNVDPEFYNHKLVDISFLMNIPTSDKETSEMVIELYNAGLLSMESAISQLSFITIANEEIDKILEEKEELGEVLNLEDILGLGSGLDEEVR